MKTAITVIALLASLLAVASLVRTLHAMDREIAMEERV